MGLPYQRVQLQIYESRILFLMTSLQYYCILGLAEIKTASQRQNDAQKMQGAQVTKSLLYSKCPRILFNLAL